MGSVERSTDTPVTRRVVVLGAYLDPEAAEVIYRYLGDNIAALAEQRESFGSQGSERVARQLRIGLERCRASAEMLATARRAASSRGSSTSSGGSISAVSTSGAASSVSPPQDSSAQQKLPGLLTVREVAGELDVTARRVRMLCQTKELPATGGGGRGKPWRIAKADFEDYKKATGREDD